MTIRFGTRLLAKPLLAAAMGLGLLASAPSQAESVLRVNMHSDLKIVDPIWTTAYMSRNYGY